MSKKNKFNTVTSVSKITALVLFVMLPVTAFYLGVAYQEKIDRPLMQDINIYTPIEKDGVACTMDAKICPDGSAVGRNGPKCEFEKCPGTK